MANLTIDAFTTASAAIYLSTGDKVKKALFVDLLFCCGVDAKTASKLWSIMNSTGRIKKNIVCDITESWSFDATATVKTVLNSLKVEDSSYLTDPLLHALYAVTGLSHDRIQSALNALENEYFLEQRRAVPPCQYVPRKWAA